SVDVLDVSGTPRNGGRAFDPAPLRGRRRKHALPGPAPGGGREEPPAGLGRQNKLHHTPRRRSPPHPAPGPAPLGPATPAPGRRRNGERALDPAPVGERRRKHDFRARVAVEGSEEPPAGIE